MADPKHIDSDLNFNFYSDPGPDPDLKNLQRVYSLFLMFNYPTRFESGLVRAKKSSDPTKGFGSFGSGTLTNTGILIIKKPN